MKLILSVSNGGRVKIGLIRIAPSMINPIFKAIAPAYLSELMRVARGFTTKGALETWNAIKYMETKYHLKNIKRDFPPLTDEFFHVDLDVTPVRELNASGVGPIIGLTLQLHWKTPMPNPRAAAQTEWRKNTIHFNREWVQDTMYGFSSDESLADSLDRHLKALRSDIEHELQHVVQFCLLEVHKRRPNVNQIEFGPNLKTNIDDFVRELGYRGVTKWPQIVQMFKAYVGADSRKVAQSEFFQQLKGTKNYNRAVTVMFNHLSKLFKEDIDGSSS